MLDEGWGPEAKPWDREAAMQRLNEDTKQVTVYAGTYDGPLMSYPWAHMAKLAFKRLQIHQGDLFHDAVWLEKNMMPNGGEFYYGITNIGTSIVTPDGWPQFKTFSDEWWHVEIKKDRYRWVAVFTKMNGE